MSYNSFEFIIWKTNVFPTHADMQKQNHHQRQQRNECLKQTKAWPMSADTVVYQWELGAIGLEETHFYHLFQGTLTVKVKRRQENRQPGIFLAAQRAF